MVERRVESREEGNYRDGAKIPSHIPPPPKPQDLYNIKPDNSNKSYDHVLLPQNTKINHPIQPLETLALSPSDFLHRAATLEHLEPTILASLDHTPFKLIETLKDLKELALVLETVDEFGVDLKHNQYRSFQGMTCLMHIPTRTKDFVMDTQKLHASIGPYLREPFKDSKKRKACNDILWLQHDFRIYVCNLFDTMLASRVPGLERSSLAYLLKYYCGVSSNKEYQTSDWRICSLPKEMIKYAREDTHYLLYIYDLIMITLVSRSNTRVLSYESDMRVALPLKYKDKYYLLLKVYKKSFKDVEGIKDAKVNVSQHGVARELYKWMDKMARVDEYHLSTTDPPFSMDPIYGPLISVSTYHFSSLSSSLPSKSPLTRLSHAFQEGKFTSLLQSNYVNQTLFFLRSKPTSAIRFFDWSENVLGYSHTLCSHCALLHILLFHRLFGPAQQVFDKMLLRFLELDVFSALCDGFGRYSSNPNTVCSFLLAGYCRNGRFDKGIDAFLRMSKTGIDVAPYALRSMLDSLIGSRCIQGIVSILDEVCGHSGKMLKQGFNLYEFVAMSLVNGHLFELALNFHRKMIDRGLVPVVVDCNKVLKVLRNEENSLEAASQFFNTMLEVGPSPNLVTFSTLIDSYCKAKRLDEAFKLYHLMMARGISPDLIVYSILIDGLFKDGKLEVGSCLLSEALEKGIKLDSVVFGSIMDAYVKVGNLEKLIEVCNRMLSEGIPSSVVTCGILINGLCQGGHVLEACGVFGEYVKRGLEPSVLSYSSLIDGFCKLGNLKEAFIWYKKMVENGHVPDLVIYSIIINGLSKQGRMHEALQLFFQAAMMGIQLNVYTFNALIDGYCRLCQMRPMMKLYSLMQDRNILPDAVTYTSLLKALAARGKLEKALALFFQILKQSISLDAIAYCTLMDSFCWQNKLKAVVWLFQLMLRNKVSPDIATYNVLLRSLFKDCRFEEAMNLFQELSTHGPEPDIVTYNTVIYGYCLSDKLNEAIQLYETLSDRPVRRTAITFTILINALCKKGRLNEAVLMFRRVLDEGIEPNVVTYSCLVDGYFKFHSMESAFELFEEMPRNKIDPNIVSFSILMDGLCQKGLIEAALSTFDSAINRGLLPDVVAYTVLIHGCCRVGRIAEAKILYRRLLVEGVVPDQVLERVVAEYHLGAQSRKLQATV
ncbi:hypothetical protein Cgig2_022011 [Carnegiea gigantea]|uniref:3'-5' exonuclease domain-containing protein n=1 Tax=Carnegiea gigantea TaxID=171969 RepID=A0A9Q1KT31_9CARY|nr:hypothetical protein Cgig2_022011 [Carnegiea gigantea]